MIGRPTPGPKFELCTLGLAQAGGTHLVELFAAQYFDGRAQLFRGVAQRRRRYYDLLQVLGMPPLMGLVVVTRIAVGLLGNAGGRGQPRAACP